jgi:hypothetical protein
MDDDAPKVFSNKIIRLMVDQLVSDDVILDPQDYLAIRIVFRRCGGRWEQFALGDQVPIELLKAILKGWGSMPERKRRSDQMI